MSLYSWAVNKTSQASEGAHILGAVVRYMFTPCGFDPLLWVELAIPAVIKGIYSVVTPDFKEAYHKIVGQSLVCSYKQEITDAQEAESVLGAYGKRFVFRLSEVLDQGVWYMFLANIAAEGVIDWTSQLLKLSPCAGVKDGSSTEAQGSVPDVTATELANGLQWLYPEGSQYWPATGASLVLGRNQVGMLGWAAEIKGVDGEDALPIVSWIERGSDGAKIDVQGPNFDKNGKPIGNIHFRKVANGDQAFETFSVRCYIAIEVTNHLGFLKHGVFFHFGGA